MAEQTNGYDRDKTQAFVKRIENLHSEIGTIMGKAKKACRDVHTDIKAVLDEAKNELGIPKKVLKRVIRARALEAKADACRDELEEADEIDSYDNVRLALGDLAETPLGQAALHVVGGRNREDVSDRPFGAPPG